MKEQPLLKRILLACSNGPARLYRMNVGQGWIGQSRRFTKTQTITVHPGDVVVRNARPFRSGVEGMHDLIGWRSVEITKEWLGKRVAVFASLEVKTPTGAVRPMQKVWNDNVTRAGGLSGIVRSVEEAKKVLTL